MVLEASVYWIPSASTIPVFSIILLCSLLYQHGCEAAPRTVDGCTEPADFPDIISTQLESLYKQPGMLNVSFASILDKDLAAQFHTVHSVDFHALARMCRAGASPILFENILKSSTPSGSESDLTRHSLVTRVALNARSTCPWFYTTNTDTTRVPQTIAEVRCACDRCLPQMEQSAARTRTRNAGYRKAPYLRTRSLGSCRPMKAGVLVFRRRCNMQSGIFDYIVDTERIAVGCQCIMPRSL